MRLIEHQAIDSEPLWDDFSISAIDFRPQWNGDLVSVYSTIRPVGDSIEETECFAIDCAKELAHWILDHRAKFGAEDRFQIIIGWDRDVRAGARQIVKTGGSFKDLAGITSGETSVTMWGHWTTNVFTNFNGELDVAPNSSLPH